MNELLQEYYSTVTLHSDTTAQAAEMIAKAEAAGVRFFRETVTSLDENREFKVSTGSIGKGCTVKVFWPVTEKKEEV